MNISNIYLVAPLTHLRSGASIQSRSITVHETHDEAVTECQRRSREGPESQKFVIYQAVTMIGRTERPTQVCVIDNDGSITCP